MIEQRRARLGQYHPAAAPQEQGLAGHLFKPQHLQVDGGIRSTDPFRGPGDAAGFDRRTERAQDVQIERRHCVTGDGEQAARQRG